MKKKRGYKKKRIKGEKKVYETIKFYQSLNPSEFKYESTSVWDFPIRGTWASHRSDYRGNFAPQIPRNIIANYSKERELILDPMVGSGTTLIEAKLLNRNAVAYDINQKAVEISKQRLDFNINNDSKQNVSIGDVRNLIQVENESIDLIITHPPYANIVKYSNNSNPNDLSSISSISEFLDELEKGVKELYRVLKPNKYCAILIGDTRKSQHYIPLSYFVLNRFLKNGFALKEEIIKTQHNAKYAQKWKAKAKNFQFYLIMHEHLFVFRKPKPDENLSRISWSIKR